MTVAGSPAKSEKMESGLLRGFTALLICLCAALLLLAGAVDLGWQQQVIVGASVVLLATVMNRSSTSYLVTLTLMLLSCFSTFRYGYWRYATAIRLFRYSGLNWTALDLFFVAILLLAESYAFLNLFLGYLQTLWPLRRAPAPLPEDTDLWPAVDLLIPTYNEPLSVVKYTALAALNIDWPADRLNVVLLDDGRREEFRTFCEQTGIRYITRETNHHAKAGNINEALKQLQAPFVAIFDSDHVPTRSFLQITMGWFCRDPRLGLLQTPHHLYSPDPFERNLNQFRVVPNEGELFYGVVQDGNDFWNATFFCGSCAVMRRSALDEVGGIAVETVTEDAHTSLRLQMNGWNTAYINIPQAAGLATERLSGHVKQRIRWARGMVQVLRIDNPLFARGLSAAQRLCYFNAMSHFLYALPRLIFLTAPLIYLVFGHMNVPGFWAATVAYAIPHLLMTNLVNSRIQGQHRHSFWNEIYETVLAPYIFLPTMLALIHPKLGRFNVTAKGGVVNRSFFDTRIATPFLLLLGMNLFGLLCAIPRVVAVPHVHSAVPLLNAVLNLPAAMHDTSHPGTVWMNVIWTLFNLTVLSVATAVARESQQRRETVRVSMTVPASVVLPDGTLLQGITTDVSSGGVMIRGEAPIAAKPNESVSLIFPVLDGDAVLPATVVAAEGNVLRAHFDRLTLQEEEALTMLLYSRADTWLGWAEAREADRPLMSLWRILQLAAHGFGGTIRDLFVPRGHRRGFTNVTHLLLLLVFFGHAFGGKRGSAETVLSAPAQGQFRIAFPLQDARVNDPIVLGKATAHRSVFFAVPQTELVQQGTMRLQYSPSPALRSSGDHLLISLNGSLIADLAFSADSAGVGAAAARSETGIEQSALQVLVLPPELLVQRNELKFELVERPDSHCSGFSNESSSARWVKIAAGSVLELTGNVLPIRNDLQILPLPFLEDAPMPLREIPVVFFGERSPKVLEAAGIVASWFGVMAGDRALRFPVSFDVLPAGNVIVLSANAAALPDTLRMAGVAEPTIALRTHPGDPFTKVLVLTGLNADELLAAARVLALEPAQVSGDTAGVRLRQPLTGRRWDDAPRWLQTGKVTPFAGLAGDNPLQSDGSEPVRIGFRLPPDLYSGDGQELPIQLAYRNDSASQHEGAALRLKLNDRPLSVVPRTDDSRAALEQEAAVSLPLSDFHAFSNEFEASFGSVSAQPGPCGVIQSRDQPGSIVKGSSFDLRQFGHWAKLPNLQLFANAGYPFTGLADLAGTAVVLPDAPSAEILELYLTLMGHFGAQTGIPGVNVAVTNAAGMNGSKDYLVLGSMDDMPALRSLQGRLPLAIHENGVAVQDLSGSFYLSRLQNWLTGSGWSRHNTNAFVGGEVPPAVVEGLRWKQHSVVLIALRDRGELRSFLPAFLQGSQGSAIANSVSVFSEGRFVSYALGGDAYHVGTLSWWGQTSWFFAQAPWLLVPAVAVICFFCAAILRTMLRRRARWRIEGVI
ncbi:MAG: UDP-forming cellulose synthase catalytic subunit [Janthinobacterium lividum]